MEETLRGPDEMLALGGARNDCRRWLDVHRLKIWSARRGALNGKQQKQRERELPTRAVSANFRRFNFSSDTYIIHIDVYLETGMLVPAFQRTPRAVIATSWIGSPLCLHVPTENSLHASTTRPRVGKSRTS